eukprot:3668381-Pleurochrysis_carterae.AAC.2
MNACLPGGHGRSYDQADEARFQDASTSARSGIGFGDAYGAAKHYCGGEERFLVSAILVLVDEANAGV